MGNPPATPVGPGAIRSDAHAETRGAVGEAFQEIVGDVLEALELRFLEVDEVQGEPIAIDPNDTRRQG